MISDEEISDIYAFWGFDIESAKKEIKSLIQKDNARERGLYVYSEDQLNAQRKSIRENVKERLKKDPIFKFNHNARSLIRESLNRVGSKKERSSILYLGCSFEFFRNYIQSLFKPGMTFENHGEWHLDHIKPCAYFNHIGKPLMANHYTNFQPLWKHENLSKGSLHNGFRYKKPKHLVP